MKKYNTTGLTFDSILLAITKVITLLLGILTTKFMSKYMSLSDYGLYSQSLVVVEATTALITFGMTDAVNYFFNSIKEKENKVSYINTMFFLEIIIGIAGAVIICSLSKPICNYFGEPHLFILLFIVCLQPLFDNLVAMLQVLYVSNKKGKYISIRSLVVSLIRLGIVIIGCTIFRNLYFVVIGFTITAFLQVFLFWIWYKKIDFIINPLKFDKKVILPVLKFGVPLGLYILVNSLLRTSDKIVLGYFASTEEMAIYSNAAKILPFDIVAASFITICAPFITKYVKNQQKTELNSLLKNYVSVSFISTIGLASVALLFSKDILLILYDDKYLPGLDVFRIYIIIEMCKFCSFYIVIMSFNRNRELLIMSLIALALNVCLDIILYHLFGSIGCAIGTLIITLAISIYMVLRTCKLTEIKLKNLIDFNFLLWSSLVIFCSLTFVYGLSKIELFETANSFVKIIILIVIYGLICLFAFYKKVKLIFKGMR
ncbi:MAG: oligosaccharide flippase family protein [Bacilli bacterium]|nr:oligosaccharide flippase family protein [Bacilli bacterium]